MHHKILSWVVGICPLIFVHIEVYLVGGLILPIVHIVDILLHFDVVIKSLHSTPRCLLV